MGKPAFDLYYKQGISDLNNHLHTHLIDRYTITEK